MNDVVYPAKVLKKENYIFISFPDLEGCLTDGINLTEATKNAQEALGLYLASLEERRLTIPKASEPNDIVCEANECVALITTDVDKYHKCKSVKKTLTIPGWLNDQAEEMHVNFSHVLQQALKEKLVLANSSIA